MFKRFLSLLIIPLSFQLYAQPVELDPTFDNDGIMSAINHPSSGFMDMLVQPDGKLICAGSSFYVNNAFSILLTRFNTDGRADSSFGTNGTALFSQNQYAGMLIGALALQPGNAIIASGMLYDSAGNSPGYFLLRFSANGVSDSSFNGTGIATYGYPADAGGGTGGMTIQPDGKILQCSSFIGATGVCLNYFVSRHNANGTIDSSFGNNGTVSVSPTNDCTSLGVCPAVQADGKIILLGTARIFQPDSDLSFIRLNADGSIDSSFGSNGISIVNISSSAEERAVKVLIQPDNKIIALAFLNTTSEKGVLLRLDENGNPDSSFGVNGIAASLVNYSSRSLLTDMAIDADGSIYCSGNTNTDGMHYPIIVKYLRDGTIDYSFGVNGVVTTTANNGQFSSSRAVALFNSRIYLAGQGDIGAGYYGTIAAYRKINSTVPVTLIQFYGTAQNDNTRLYWQAGTPVNARQYLVQKSPDGLHFDKIGTVAANSIQYTFTDAASVATARFYRLQIIHADGSFSYSAVIRFEGKTTSPGIRIYPNPVKDVLNVMLHTGSDYNSLQIIDTKGSVVKTVEKKYPGSTAATIDVQFLSPGIYYLLAKNKNTVMQLRFVKQ